MSGRSSFLADDEAYRQAGNDLDCGRDLEALAAAQELKRRGYPAADFLLGEIHEFGGPRISIDLEKAVSHYRRAAYIERDAVSTSCLARALMKHGHEHYAAARACLHELEKFGPSARLSLAWAWYFETSPEPDLRKACSHYLRAALRGRFLGFFGYSRVSRRMGHYLRAFACDVTRLMTGWLIFLVVGRRARFFF